MVIPSWIECSVASSRRSRWTTRKRIVEPFPVHGAKWGPLTVPHTPWHWMPSIEFLAKRFGLHRLANTQTIPAKTYSVFPTIPSRLTNNQRKKPRATFPIHSRVPLCFQTRCKTGNVYVVANCSTKIVAIRLGIVVAGPRVPDSCRACDMCRQTIPARLWSGLFDRP